MSEFDRGHGPLRFLFIV